MNRYLPTIALLFIVSLLLAPMAAPFSPDQVTCSPFQVPDKNHLLGCNDMGQDLFSRLLAGAPLSLATGLISALVCVLIATGVALYSSQRRGIPDQLLMRTVDLMLAIPFLPLVIVLAAYWGHSGDGRLWVLVLALWPVPVRELRSQLLEVRQRGYVRASQQMGASLWQRSHWHLLPELLPLLMPQFVRIAHMAILLEAALAFLGLGDPQQLSWGSMLYQASNRAAFLNDSWLWWVVPPGLMIGLSVASLSLLGMRLDGLPGKQTPSLNSPTKYNISALSDKLLKIDQLNVSYQRDDIPHMAVQSLSLSLKPGQSLALIGESGSGKSSLLRAVLGLLPTNGAITGGEALYQDQTQTVNLRTAAASQWQQLRGYEIAYVPQNAMNALDPVKTIGQQLQQAARRLPNLDGVAALQRHCETLLGEMGLSSILMNVFPHQLSGGMRQRVLLAIALCTRPRLLLADEATSGLDVVTREEILQCLTNYRKKHKLSLIMVSHDIRSAMRYADQVGVMLNGHLVDFCTSANLGVRPTHSYSQMLLNSHFTLDSTAHWQREAVKKEGTPLLSLKLLHFSYNLAFELGPIDLQLYPGEVVGLVGSSGSGKTTLAHLLSAQIQLTKGTLSWCGKRVEHDTEESFRQAVHTIQQDPYQSVRGDLNIYDAVREPMRIRKLPEEKQRVAVADALCMVQLPSEPDFLTRRVNSLSGGQRQRVAFARAVVQQPQILIADEPTSMLDASLQKDLLEQLEQIRQHQQPAMLFITHDLALARHFCDRILVMHNGNVVEQGLAADVCLNPKAEITRTLRAAALA